VKCGSFSGIGVKNFRHRRGQLLASVATLPI
jgi:hypothetical protein